jgi:hypothetical protein
MKALTQLSHLCHGVEGGEEEEEEDLFIFNGTIEGEWGW